MCKIYYFRKQGKYLTSQKKNGIILNKKNWKLENKYNKYGERNDCDERKTNQITE